MSDTPDIQPERMSATDVASLAPIEVYAVLVHLAGSDNPVVTQALIDATRRVLARTRGRLRDRPHPVSGDDVPAAVLRDGHDRAGLISQPAVGRPFPAR